MITAASTMKSPFSEKGKVTLNWEMQELEFRKEKFQVWYPFYRCEDTKLQFTTDESDAVWCRQLHNAYCIKHGIPFTDEIVGIREKYGLSAQKMSLILGFGDNQWRRYENDEVPSVSNGKMIRSVMNPHVMLEMVESSRIALGSSYGKVLERVSNALTKDSMSSREHTPIGMVFTTERSAENGYAQLSPSRLKNLMLRIIEKQGEVWYTKMNKLLFYIDFNAYRVLGQSISGLAYKALEFGPVPERWDRVYSSFNEIEPEIRQEGDFEGTVLTAKCSADTSMFSEDEIRIIDSISAAFLSLSARQISELSHNESAWKNHKATKERIPFWEAFRLQEGLTLLD